jgi:HK97 family phage portal protein
MSRKWYNPISWFQNGAYDESTNVEDPEVPLSNAEAINDASSDVKIDEEKALTVSTVFRCVMLLADTIAGLPIKIYSSDGEEQTDHKYKKLITAEPNTKTTKFGFFQWMMIRALLWGDAFVEIRRKGNGEAFELIPIPNNQVEVVDGKKQVSYKVTADPNKPGDTRNIPSRNMLHILGLNVDGFQGYDAIRKSARVMLSLVISMEKSSERMHKNGTMPSGLVTHPREFSPAALRNLRQTFNKIYQGVANAGKTIFLDGGMTWENIQMSFKDAEMLESRRFGIEEIARFFGVPLNMIGELTKNTSWGTGIEQQNIAFVMFTLLPWMVRIEQEFNRKLMLDSGDYIKLKAQGLMRGDMTTRKEFYSAMIQHAVINPNMVARLEDWPEYEGGDQYYRMANLVPVGEENENQTD